jgi:hypothetical protein
MRDIVYVPKSGQALRGCGEKTCNLTGCPQGQRPGLSERRWV